MCRHLAYLGEPVPLASLLFDPPHALCRQAWAPRDMRGGGTVNVDGFGVGWFPAPDAAPVRYRRATPIWSDPSLMALAGVTASGAVLAAVRSATVGMPVTEGAAAPFTEGRWLFSHNGKVTGWPDSVAGLAARLPVRDLLTLDAPTDSALLWALVRDRLRAGAGPGAALAGTVTAVGRAAPDSRLNLLLTDGERVAATTWGHALSYLDGLGSLTVGSEPLDDDPAWVQMPPRHLLVATRSTLDLTPLEAP